MEEKMLYYKNIINEEKTVMQLEYCLLISSAEQGQSYGAAIRKMECNGTSETDHVSGLFEDRADAETFLAKLAEGTALPVELAALCDDYISEQEYLKNRTMVQEAS